MSSSATPKRVLVTGVHGLIGSQIYTRLAAQPERYEPYGLDRSPLPSPRIAALPFSPLPAERLRLADLGDFAAVAAAVAGMDTIIHLAADPNGRAGWESVLANNIIGAHNLHATESSNFRKSVNFRPSRIAKTILGNTPHFCWPNSETRLCR